MSSVATVQIHSSQFPRAVRRDLLKSLRARQVNHKFHYDSIKQTQKWLALHQVHSPSRNDADCAAVYDRSFEAAAKIKTRRVHVIGLGCGGGQKDTRLLRLLKKGGKDIFYTPSDVSTAMVLMARQTALAVVREENCFPLVCDLGTANDLPEVLDQYQVSSSSRIFTFFGMIPNFEPDQILSELASLIRPKDFLLFSANLAPGADYHAGLKKILPQYDNALTRDWLMTFLLDLGVERNDGELKLLIEDGQQGLKRVAAYFQFKKARRLKIEDEQFEFVRGERICLFFSYRHTPDRVHQLLGRHGLKVLDQWITQSEEEGVFLVHRAGA